MKAGEKILSFNLSTKKENIGAGGLTTPPPPKGCIAVRVGPKEEEQQRFVVPVVYLNHPLFATLLKEAEEEYGFEQEGAITIPCHVEHFRQVRGLIDKEATIGSSSSWLHHSHSHPLGHLHIYGCFRA